MKRLPDHIENIGAGYSGKDNVTADLVKRIKNVAIYKRSDGYYEVGIIRATEGGKGKFEGKTVVFEAKEYYFSNSVFGDIARCTDSLEKAQQYMEEYLASDDKKVSQERIYTS